MNKYYQVCLRHMGKNDNCFLLWGKNGSGYYRSIEDSGVYAKKNEDLTTQIKRGDFLVSVEVIEKLKVKIRLPKYGDKEETYCNKNEFYVLPNTGQVRKELGITKLDIQLDGNRDSFFADFDNTIIEKYKFIYSDTHFRVRAKEHVSEFWYMDGEFEADSRNQAINQAFNEWIPADYENYIQFKKDVKCSRVKTKVLDKWVEINAN